MKSSSVFEKNAKIKIFQILIGEIKKYNCDNVSSEKWAKNRI